LPRSTNRNKPNIQLSACVDDRKQPLIDCANCQPSRFKPMNGGPVSSPFNPLSRKNLDGINERYAMLFQYGSRFVVIPFELHSPDSPSPTSLI
jgi:hypothetical protein